MKLLDKKWIKLGGENGNEEKKEVSEMEEKKGLSTGQKVGLGALGLATLAALGFGIKKIVGKKDRDYDEDDYDVVDEDDEEEEDEE